MRYVSIAYIEGVICCLYRSRDGHLRFEKKNVYLEKFAGEIVYMVRKIIDDHVKAYGHTEVCEFHLAFTDELNQMVALKENLNDIRKKFLQTRFYKHRYASVLKGITSSKDRGARYVFCEEALWDRLAPHKTPWEKEEKEKIEPLMLRKTPTEEELIQSLCDQLNISRELLKGLLGPAERDQNAHLLADVKQKILSEDEPLYHAPNTTCGDVIKALNTLRAQILGSQHHPEEKIDCLSPCGPILKSLCDHEITLSQEEIIHALSELPRHITPLQTLDDDNVSSITLSLSTINLSLALLNPHALEIEEWVQLCKRGEPVMDVMISIQAGTILSFRLNDGFNDHNLSTHALRTETNRIEIKIDRIDQNGLVLMIIDKNGHKQQITWP